MSTPTRLSTYDRANRQVRIRISKWHLLVLVAAKFADSLSTILALSLAPDTLAEAQPHTAVLINSFGVVEGTLVVGWFALVTAVVVAELGGASLERVRQWSGAPGAWVAYDVTAFTYYLVAAWFALLAVSNIWVVASTLGGVS